MKSLRPAMGRILPPLLIAGLFYWELVARPRAGGEELRGVQTGASLKPEEARDLAEASQTLIQEGRDEEALGPSLKLNEAFPENHIYIERLAEIYHRLGRYDEEAQFWEKYLDHAPHPLDACPQIGQAYWKQGKEKEAISAFERCLALDPESTGSIFYFAHALEMSQEFEPAAEMYKRGLSLSPHNVDLRVGLARVEFRQGQLSQAKETVADVMARSPNNVDALLVLGLVYTREGDLRRARIYLEKGVKLSEGYTDFHIALGRIADRESNIPEAIRQYNRVLELKPENEEIRARRDALRPVGQ